MRLVNLAGYRLHPVIPAEKHVMQLAFIAPSPQNHAIPAQAGTHFPTAVALSERARSSENSQIQVLVERWVPACAGMAREVRGEITAIGGALRTVDG